jgi:hypothetical protein
MFKFDHLKMRERLSSLPGQVHDLVKSKEKELDQVDIEARQRNGHVTLSQFS